MMTLIEKYGGTILVLVIVSFLVTFLTIKLIKDKKKGKTSCGCGCKNCPSAGVCSKNK